MYIAIDQYNQIHHNIKEPTKKGIRKAFCLSKNAKISEIYIDKLDDSVKQIGFVIDKDDLWLTLYCVTPWEIDAK